MSRRKRAHEFARRAPPAAYTSRLPQSYLTAGLAGTGGSIKRDSEDFVVEEIPLYEPDGEGEHLYLWIEKRNLTTFEAVRRLAREFGVRERDIGYAGLKDARAVTRQWISVPGGAVEHAHDLAIENVTVLGARLHGNKLKLGHLRGNRFDVAVHRPEAPDNAHPVLETLARRGVPNRFGAQRFGSRGTSHHLGAALLRADYDGFLDALLGGEEGLDTSPGLADARTHFKAQRFDDALAALPNKLRAEKKALYALVRHGDARRAAHAVPVSMRRLYVSALQSWIFNRILARRLETLDRLAAGDLAFLHRNGSVFSVGDPAIEKPRCDAFEISPSGPLLGLKSLLADGEPGTIEREIIAETGFTRRDFAVGAGVRLDGARRPLRAPLADWAIEPRPDGFRLRFTLPRGSFATVVLEEVMKPRDRMAIPPPPPARRKRDGGDLSDTL